VRGSCQEIINQALNQTLSRTLNYLRHGVSGHDGVICFGGGVINDFAFTFLSASSPAHMSSIYIASALVLWLPRRTPPSALRR